MLEFDAAIFDMDGTILDSMSVWDRIDLKFLQDKRGITVPDDYVKNIATMSFLEIAEYTKMRFSLPDSPQELMDEWTEMAVFEYTNNIKLKCGAKQYIEKLKAEGKRIILCTSSPEIFYEPALKKNNIYDLFDAFCSTCEVGKGKASPDVFLLAANKASADISKCLVFEDTLKACQSAKSIGMSVCGVYDERSSSNRKKMEEICDLYIDSFEQLI